MSWLRAFLAELKRRRVYRVAIVYAATAFAVAEAADLFFPRLALPEWTVTLIVVLAVLGFPIALVLAWAFEVSPEGVRRTEPAPEEGPAAQPPGPWGSLAATAGAALLLGVGWWLFAGSAAREAPTPPISEAAVAEPAAASLAVLPLENYARDPGQEYFADGMTEELITTLAKIEGLRVIAHRSVRQFQDSDASVREIARLLAVRHVVDGSVLQEGDRVRITASLIDAETETPLWGDRFERERRDVMALQREVALAIAREIDVALTPEDESRLGDTPEVDPEAFDLYVRGTQVRYQRNSERIGEVADFFEQAIARDSGFAPAYAGLAFVLAFPGQDASRARQLARRALELDPNLADAHVALGQIRQLQDWDWAGAEEAFREAIRVNPGHAEAHHELSMLLMRHRRFDEALSEARQALSLAPLTARFENALGQVYLNSGRYQEALGAAEKARVLDPSSFWYYLLAGLAYEQLGQHEKATKAFEKGRQGGCADYCLTALGHIHAVSGRNEEALEVLEGLKARRDRQGEQAVRIGIIYAGLGDRGRALDWLERGLEEKGGWLFDLGVDPRFRSLYGEARFQALLKKLGLN